MTEQLPERIGARLRAAREESGVSLRQIADATKLSVRTLQALEGDRIAQLPGGIYRRAIVRSYAREIGLDAEVTLRGFLAQYPDDLPAPPPLPARKPSSCELQAEPDRPRHRASAAAVILSILGALVPIAAGIFYFTIALGGDGGPRHVADVMPPRATDGWRPDIAPAAGFSEAPPASSPIAVMITVSSQCRLQVIADGREVVSRVVTPGELLQLVLSQDIVLSGDNAGAVHISLNGQAGRSLGDADAPLDVRIARDDYTAWLGLP